MVKSLISTSHHLCAMAITTCSTDNISILPSSNNENAEPSHLIQAPSTEITDVGNGNVTPQQDEEDPTIPRADGGKDAWLFLAGCFMFEGIVWGKYLPAFPFPAFPPLPLTALKCRFPLLLRCIPNLLHLSPALLDPPQRYSYNRHLRHGNHVLILPLRYVPSRNLSAA